MNDNKFVALTLLMQVVNQSPSCLTKKFNNQNDLLIYPYYPTGYNITMLLNERLNFPLLTNLRNVNKFLKRWIKKSTEINQVFGISDLAHHVSKINFTKNKKTQNREKKLKKDKKIIKNLRSNYQFDRYQKWKKLLIAYKIEIKQIKQITANMPKIIGLMSFHEKVLKLKISCEAILTALQRMIIKYNIKLEKYYIIIFKLLELIN